MARQAISKRRNDVDKQIKLKCLAFGAVIVVQCYRWNSQDVPKTDWRLNKTTKEKRSHTDLPSKMRVVLKCLPEREEKAAGARKIEKLKRNQTLKTHTHNDFEANNKPSKYVYISNE